jgi:cytochrome c biogenesis protein
MSTTAVTPNTRRRALAETVELLSSMRFAITMLVMIAIASIIGTVIKQGEPMPNYINQFGPFWYEVFDKLGLYAIYSTWWFILILLFLIASTTFCIIRNTPKMLRDMKSWKENVRETSLRNFHHKAEWSSQQDAPALARQSAARLAHAGYQVKIVEKEQGVLVAAKRGAANKFGYIFAHSAIIIILVGGSLDSDLPIQLQQWVFGKTGFEGSGLIAEIPQKHWLSLNNPSFRGNTSIAEGQRSNVAIIPRPDGALIQPLPFEIELKKFTIDFYSTGMPKLFASDVVVHDKEEGRTIPATIRVNHPLIYKGVAMYQSDFRDGGSKLTLTGHPMRGADAAPFAIKGEVNGSNQLTRGGETWTVEWSDFRAFNVENLGASQDPRSVAQGESFNEQFARTLDKHSGSAAKNADNKDLKNVGPSVTYKLRDQTGQAREFHNYMQPVTIDGAQVFLAGVRANPNDPFSYLRIPADKEHTVKDWMRLRAALSDPALRAQAAERYARRAAPEANPALAGQVRESALRSLAIFAGADGQGAQGESVGGFLGVQRFLQKIPAEEQEKAANIFMKILNGSLWELWQAARVKDGLAEAAPDDANARFLQLSTNALADSVFYGAPVYLQLDDFVQVQASVLQVSRAPGKSIVYLGCLFLTLGVFAMFYIRERRLWVWIKPDGAGAHALMAMSTQRKTYDFEREFEQMKTTLPQLA